MKKILLTAAFIGLIGFGRAFAGVVDAPSGQTSNPINADYGGVDVATSVFSAAVATVANVSISTNTDYSSRRWRIYGANFSTGACASVDFVTVLQSTSGAGNGNSREIYRFYNVQGSTTTTAGSVMACEGTTWLRWPIRATGNLFFQPSVATYNQIELLYWKEENPSSK